MAENRTPTSVTDAQEAADKDYRQRVKRYTISMIIRVVCLLLAFVFTGWLRWVMLGGAVVLPYIAVVIANSRNERLFDYDMASMRDPAKPTLSPEASQRPTTWQENGQDGRDDEGRRSEGDRGPAAADEPVIIGEVLGDTLEPELNAAPERGQPVDEGDDADGR